MKTRLMSIGIKSVCFLLISVSILLTGCERVQQQAGVLPTAPAEQAHAVIGSLNDSGVTGMAVFTQNGDHITFMAEIQGASPGLHAIHIHANGDCSAPDGTSAGGHWNPTDVAHGKWGEGEFHLGDIGNITVGEDGTGRITLTTDLWEIGTGSDVDVVGKGIIVHADADDFVSQPSGNAGARIGCGVIVLTE
ncbi:MAG: superoxide dismutase family protein [Candidatus Poribacteria bacterium]|nr:superoxide dismutase family protein [Candidatus Poribacteria bacterium]